MRTYCFTIIFVLFLAGIIPEKPSAQNSYKKVTISVIDAVSGKPVEGAEVMFKALLGKQVKKTNSEGKAFFEMMLITESLNLNYTVNCPAGSRTYKPYSGSITLVSSKDSFEYTALVQPNSRMVSFKISDDKRQPLANVTVKLKDDNGIESETKSDANGVAIYDIAPGVSYKNAMLTVFKDGFNEYSIPVEISDQTTQVSVIAILTAKSNIVVNYDQLNTPHPVAAGPLANVLIRNLPPGYKLPQPANVTWGPYSPSCFNNPLVGLSPYGSLFIADEKSLLDRISSSCLGAAGEAIDALAEVTENIVDIRSKLDAVYTYAFQIKKTDQLIEAARNFPDSLKITGEDAVKTKNAINEAVEKTSDLFEKMAKLAAGPELYAINCIWEGFEGYIVPESLMNLKKSTESIRKAKTATQEKMEAMKIRMASGEALTYADKDLFLNWKDITENVGKTWSGLSLIYSSLSEPTTILPYETQVNLAISTAETMMGTLMGNCQIRELDRQIKQGISAGQAALVAGRKQYARLMKAKRNSYDLITAYVNKNFKEQDRGWTRFEPGDYRLKALPQQEYQNWANSTLQAASAAKDTLRLNNRLIHLGELCNQIQPMANALNERVKKYEDLFTKGLLAIDSCKLDAARTIIKQLQAYENSDCGHFFPKPFGKTKSEELSQKIEQSKFAGKCVEVVPAGAYVLTKTVLNPYSSNIEVDDKSYLDYTLDENYKEVPGISYTLLSPVPSVLLPGQTIKVDISGSCLYEKARLDYQPQLCLYSESSGTEYGYNSGKTKTSVGRNIETEIFTASAKGTMELNIPEDAGNEFLIYLHIRIPEGFSTRWVEYYYERK